jgi:hypothetical protein
MDGNFGPGRDFPRSRYKPLANSYQKQTSSGREAAMESDTGSRVISMPRMGGLHHRYVLAA